MTAIRNFLITLSFSTMMGNSGGGFAQTNQSFDPAIPNRVEVHQDNGQHSHDHHHLDPAQVTTEMQVALVASELAVGPNRMAVGLIDSQGGIIHDAEVHFHYFDLSDPQAPLLESEADAVALRTPDGFTTIFAQERTFDRAGNWGLEVQARLPNGTAAVKRIAFQVVADAQALAVGEKAPALDTPTAADVNRDFRQLTSATAPNLAFYQLSLAESMANNKPTVLLFATPAFCQTRFCGPAYEIASHLQEQHSDVANFIHIEVYSGIPNPAANNWELAPAMKAFGLNTEPWLYLLDKDGTVAYRVEGMFTQAEVERHLLTVLGR